MWAREGLRVVHLKKALAGEAAMGRRIEELPDLVELLVLKGLSAIAGSRKGLQLGFAQGAVMVGVEAREDRLESSLEGVR